MLKGFWPGNAANSAAGDVTPKAPKANKKTDESNPWEQTLSPNSAQQRQQSLAPAPSVSMADAESANNNTTPLASPGGITPATATTSLSTNPPDFSIRPPPLKRQQTNNPTLSSKGHLTVKIMEARGLAVPNPSVARPYCVVTFEQNEFVSREPIGAGEALAKGVARNKLEDGPRPVGSGASGGVRTPTTTGPAGGLFGPSGDCPFWKHEVTFDVAREDSPLEIAVYDRVHAALPNPSPADNPPADASLAALSLEPPPEGEHIDYDHYEGEAFLGHKEIRLRLTPGVEVDQWYKLEAMGKDKEGKEIRSEKVTGEIRLQILYERFASRHSLTPRDFEFLRLIGRGTFGRVFQVRKKDTKRIYAMKVLSKKEIIAKKEVAHTIGERKILQVSLECPFLVGLKFSFQTDKELYFVTDYKSGGELFWHLQREGRFSEDRARFYIAELVLALEHLHKYDIVYRDLKPENILLDATGHVALCDFGLSKPDLPADQLTSTFCGTTEYLAPEVLLNDDGYSMLVDFWSLGVLLFEMCCGWSPFYAEDTQQMYKNICFGKIRFPKGVIGDDGKQFVKGLLNRNPEHRLGARRDAAELKEHAFFKSIDWDALAARQVTPPFKPLVESDESVANFDTEFTSADLREHGVPWDDDVAADDNVPAGAKEIKQPSSTANGGSGSGAPTSPLTGSVQDSFRGFTYTGENMMDEAARSLGATHLRSDPEEEILDDDDDRPGGRYARKRQDDSMEF